MKSSESSETEKKRDWPSGFWEKLHALGPLSDGFALPEPLPEKPYRDEVLEWFSEEIPRADHRECCHD